MTKNWTDSKWHFAEKGEGGSGGEGSKQKWKFYYNIPSPKQSSHTFVIFVQ